MIAENDGSYTVNVNGGKVTLSTRNNGLGKTYKTASEAFKDADYATAIDRPEEPEYDLLWGFLGALLFVAVFGYGFWRTIS